MLHMLESLTRSFWKHGWADQNDQDKEIYMFPFAYILEDLMPHRKHSGFPIFYPIFLWENTEVKRGCKGALGRQT